MCTTSHSSDDGVCAGTFQTGLQVWCIGRPTGLPDAPTPVSPQCTCTTDLQSEIQRPYYRCAHQPSLVAGFRADPVQGRCHGVQSAIWTCTKLPRAWTSSRSLGPLVRVADVSGRRSLRSAGLNLILVPPVTSITVGSRAFPVAAPLIWNSLPVDVNSAESLPTFKES